MRIKQDECQCNCSGLLEELWDMDDDNLGGGAEGNPHVSDVSDPAKSSLD